MPNLAIISRRRGWVLVVRIPQWALISLNFALIIRLSVYGRLIVNHSAGCHDNILMRIG